MGELHTHSQLSDFAVVAGSSMSPGLKNADEKRQVVKTAKLGDAPDF
jgi:hypothetical protein